MVMKRAALLLAGCGAKDGSEIQEATLALYYLDVAGYSTRSFALVEPQRHVVNHLTGEIVAGGQSRVQIEESARIVRGSVSDIEELKVEEFDCLVIPGGTGLAKNCFTFAIDGLEFSIEERYRSVVEAFHTAGKPIAAMCIAPLSLCKIIGGVSVTLGPEGELTKGVEERFGAKVIEVGRRGVVVDSENRVVSTASYMYDDSTIADIGAGAEALVKSLSTLLC